MSIVKVIEVIASSEKSIEDALQQAVAEASKTIRNIDSVYVKDIKAHVKDGKVSSYGLITKISFRLDENEQDNAPEQATAETEATPTASNSTGVASVTPKVPQQAEATTEAAAQPAPEASQQEDTEQISSEERYKQGVTADQEQETQPQQEAQPQVKAESQPQAQATEAQPEAQSEQEAQQQSGSEEEEEQEEELTGEETDEEKENKPAHKKDFVPAH